MILTEMAKRKKFVDVLIKVCALQVRHANMNIDVQYQSVRSSGMERTSAAKGMQQAKPATTNPTLAVIIR